ncbi:MAG: N-acetylneuraminate synthase family protein [Treponema sp.]|jgi:N-acetylneuraminate synthase|nr:N-acetylneuraminate synthase family protein [Treponema sp.]
MNTYIEIAERKVGLDYEPLIIAELGINHHGSLRIAKEMVDAAWEGGAELVKHQTHIVEDEMSPEAKKVIPGNAHESIFEIMEKASLDEDEERELKAYIESKGMIFLSTPFSRRAADRLERMGVKAYKIGSGECNNYPLIEHIAAFGKPMIVSTGMNDINSIKKTVAILEKNTIPYILLHTTNLYPTPPHLVRLGGMIQLQREFPNAVVGLSDHTCNNNACIAAVALGASLLERHFTDTMSRLGPDIVCSMDGEALKALKQSVHEVYVMRGGTKDPIAEEQITKNFAFATVVAIKDINAGEILTRENIWVKRPGTLGIFAESYAELLDCRCNIPVKKDSHLTWEMIEKTSF